MPQLPPDSAEDISQRQASAQMGAIVPESMPVVAQDDVVLPFGQLETPVGEQLDGLPGMPSDTDLAHVVEKGDHDYAVMSLEPGGTSHDPVHLQGMLDKSAFLCVMMGTSGISEKTQ